MTEKTTNTEVTDTSPCIVHGCSVPLPLGMGCAYKEHAADAGVMIVQFGSGIPGDDVEEKVSD